MSQLFIRQFKRTVTVVTVQAVEQSATITLYPRKTGYFVKTTIFNNTWHTSSITTIQHVKTCSVESFVKDKIRQLNAAII